jgi:hypothetical protein
MSKTQKYVAYGLFLAIAFFFWVDAIRRNENGLAFCLACLFFDRCGMLVNESKT